MTVPKARKLSSGKWFIQLRLGGESVSVTGETEKKCVAEARQIKAEHLAGKRVASVADDTTLRQAIDAYIKSRDNILSPSTLVGYDKIRDHRFKGVMDGQLSLLDIPSTSITQLPVPELPVGAITAFAGVA